MEPTARRLELPEGPSSFGTKDPANAGSSLVIAWGERQRANPSVKHEACPTAELLRR